ncbi:FixH family protein [Leptospira sp. GIMC2001]|uniref:FixH family protein n=1 Tax=Leptospira sp. GIMC2001 TaxID=1513297 RepID=UPI00234B3F86|nr:FixH family protein [Leptospira sp. GIMC2001]WCL50506.1 FixH family protein [Leptospira sp. GIMC2001]
MKFKDLDKSVKYAFYSMGAIFILLFIATGITVYIAKVGHEDVIEKDYYEKGLNYEKTLEDIRIMQDEGYSISSPLLVDRFPLHSGKNLVQISFTKNDIPISDGKLFVLLERGATAKFNQSNELYFSNNEYSGEIMIPDLGQWIITIKASHAGRTLTKTLKVTVQK